MMLKESVGYAALRLMLSRCQKLHEVQYRPSQLSNYMREFLHSPVERCYHDMKFIFVLTRARSSSLVGHTTP